MAAWAGASVVGGANCGQPSATDWFCSACEEATCSLCRGLARSTTASTHTHGRWSGTTRASRYQKKHSPTHTHPDHRTPFMSFLHLLRSIASSVFSLCAWQSSLTTSLQVLFGLPLGPSASYSMHFFTQSSSSLRSTCPLQPSTTILQLLASTHSEPKMTPTEDLGQTDHVNTLSNHSVLSAAATAWSSLTALLQNATSLPPFRCKLNTPWHPMSTVTSQWKPTATFLQAGCYSWRPTNSVKALKTTKLREVLI